METWVVYLLGAIALGSLVQVLFLAVLGWGGLRLLRRVRAMQGRVEQEIRPALDSVTHIAHNVSAIAELTTLQAQRIEGMIEATRQRVEEARARVREATRRPMEPLGNLSAMFKGFRRGVQVYRRLGALEAQARGSSRRYRDDEHLFI
jgi:hypothetical protein